MTYCFRICCLVISLLLPAEGSTWGFTLIAPTEGQKVREKVRIVIPANEVPDGGFVALLVGEAGHEVFLGGMSRTSGVRRHGNLIYYWNSKSPYRDPSDPSTDRFLPDGPHKLTVQIHDGTGVMISSASVSVNLSNKVPRTNPAPAVNMAYRFVFGQSCVYRVVANVQVFDAVGLPVMGSLGLNANWRVLQSVEDARPGGQYLLRYRIDDDAYVSAFAQKRFLYLGCDYKPQLYRLITKYGSVLKANMFTKQAKYSITDILPVLPGRSVKEGDAWPAEMKLKIEGLTDVIPLKGSSMLESFEYYNGQECAKIISRFTGPSSISLLGGKITSASDSVSVHTVSYFAYKAGRFLASETKIEFPATYDPNATDFVLQTEPVDQKAMKPSLLSPTRSAEADVLTNSSYSPPSNTAKSGGTGSGGQRGTVQMSVSVRLER